MGVNVEQTQQTIHYWLTQLEIHLSLPRTQRNHHELVELSQSLSMHYRQLYAQNEYFVASTNNIHWTIKQVYLTQKKALSELISSLNDKVQKPQLIYPFSTHHTSKNQFLELTFAVEKALNISNLLISLLERQRYVEERKQKATKQAVAKDTRANDKRQT